MSGNSSLVFLFSIISIAFSNAQPPDLEADRPDQTETSSIVPIKHFQMETGFVFEYMGNDKTYTHPSALLKYGLFESLELRLIIESLTFKTEDRTTKMKSHSGVVPLELGMKVKLFEEKKRRPSASLIGHIGVPWAASEEFRTEYFPFNFRFALQHTLTKWLSLGYNAGAEWDGESAEPTFIYTLVTGFSATDKIGMFLEGYGFIPQQSSSTHFLDAGLTYLPMPNLMLDISGGWGITDRSYFIGCGFSYRLPY